MNSHIFIYENSITDLKLEIDNIKFKLGDCNIQPKITNFQSSSIVDDLNKPIVDIDDINENSEDVDITENNVEISTVYDDYNSKVYE